MEMGKPKRLCRCEEPGVYCKVHMRYTKTSVGLALKDLSSRMGRYSYQKCGGGHRLIKKKLTGGE